jgi:hypothetical protein
MATAELLINIMASAGSASTVIGELQMQTRQLEQIMANTSKTVTSTAAKTEESSGLFGKLGNEFGKIGTMAIGMATGMLAANVSMGIAERVSQAATQIDEYGKAVLRVQRITGESAQSSSLLVAIFQRYSPSLDQAIGKLTRFEAVLAGQEDIEGISGGKGADAMLKLFGVEPTDANGKLKPTLEILYQLADGFKASDDAAAKALAMRTFFGQARGAGGDAMLKMLNQGREGLEQTAAAAQKYGMTLTGENLEDVRQFGLAHKDLDMALQGVSIQLGAAFMPAITGAAKATAVLGQNLNQSVLPTIKAIGASSATPAILTMASGLTLLAGAIKVASVVMASAAGPFILLGAVIWAASAPLRHALDVLYEVKAAYAALTPEQLAVPGVQGLANIIGKLPGTSPADLLPKMPGSELGNELPEDTTPGNVKAATKAADAAKVELQAQQNAAAERKAQFDIDSLESTTTLLNLKAQEVDANQALVAFKREMEDIDRSAVNFAEQRLKLEEQRAVLLAQQAAGPLKNQSEDIQFQENLIKAQIKAARAGGAPVDTGALRQRLHALQREGTVLEPSLLIAEHNVSLADRTKSATDLTSGLAANAVDQRKLSVSEAMQPAQDAATAAKRQVEDQQHIVDLEKQTFDLKEQGFQAELLIATMRDKSATAAQLLVQHPEQFPVFGPAPVGSPAEAGAEAGAAAGSEAPVIGDINITAGVGTTLDDVLQAVTERIAAAWAAATQGTPVVGPLGGAFQPGSGGGTGGFG